MSCRHSFPCQKHFQHPMIFSGHSDRRRWPARFWHARGKRHARRSPQPGGAPAARRRARNVRAVAWHAVSRPHPPPANQTRPVSPKTDCHTRQDAAAASGVGTDTTRRPAEAAEVGTHKDSEQLPPTTSLTSPSTFRKGCRDTHHRSKTTTQSRLDLSGGLSSRAFIGTVWTPPTLRDCKLPWFRMGMRRVTVCVVLSCRSC